MDRHKKRHKVQRQMERFRPADGPPDMNTEAHSKTQKVHIYIYANPYIFR